MAVPIVNYERSPISKEKTPVNDNNGVENNDHGSDEEVKQKKSTKGELSEESREIEEAKNKENAIEKAEEVIKEDEETSDKETSWFTKWWEKTVEIFGQLIYRPEQPENHEVDPLVETEFRNNLLKSARTHSWQVEDIDVGGAVCHAHQHWHAGFEFCDMDGLLESRNLNRYLRALEIIHSKKFHSRCAENSVQVNPGTLILGPGYHGEIVEMATTVFTKWRLNHNPGTKDATSDPCDFSLLYALKIEEDGRVDTTVVSGGGLSELIPPNLSEKFAAKASSASNALDSYVDRVEAGLNNLSGYYITALGKTWRPPRQSTELITLLVIFLTLFTLFFSLGYFILSTLRRGGDLEVRNKVTKDNIDEDYLAKKHLEQHKVPE